MPKGKLTPKQERFVQEYLIDLNATQAAIRAGYKEPNTQGPRLLVNVGVASAIAAKQTRLADKYEVTADRVVRELALLGFSNMLDYVTPRDDGFVHLDLSAVSRDQAAAIQEVTIDEYQERDPNGEDGETRTVKKVKFKLSDKRSALVELGKHLGMFDSAGDEALKEGLAALLKSGRKRAAETQAQSVH